MMLYVLEFRNQAGQWEALTKSTTETDANLCGAIYRTTRPCVEIRITTRG